MQTKEADTSYPNANIVFQVSTKSPIELLSARLAYDCAKKVSWDVQDNDIKKDIKTGNLIFDLTLRGETNSSLKKLSETIEVSYGSKKLKKETHDIIQPKGEIDLEGFQLNYEISKSTRGDRMEIKFTSEQSISLQGLQTLGDDNKPIGSPVNFIRVITSGHPASYMSIVSIAPEEVKQVKKVSFSYYPGPYKTVKIPVELRLPLK